MASPEDLAAFINRHRELLANEREAEVERSALLLSNCGPKLLEQKGLALIGLGVVGINVGLGGKMLIELERPAAYHTTSVFPPHTIRPGDLARIEENAGAGPAKKTSKPKKPDATSAVNSKSAEGVVYKMTDTRIVIAVDPDDDEVDLPERCRIVKLANSVTYDRMDKALNHLEKVVLPDADKPPKEMTRLTQVLLGMAAPSARAAIADIAFFDPALNQSQKDAVAFALSSPEVACIHGPPGTGKTHTLIEIIRQLTRAARTPATPANPATPGGQRVLVCGASNLSVDNILERLLALPPGDTGEGGRLRATRIGHPARVMGHAGVLEATLDAQAARSDQAALAKDVKTELEAALAALSGKGTGTGTGKGKGKPPRGLARKKMWDDVKALRKEYRQREGGVVKSVLAESQIVLATCHSAGGRQLRYDEFDVVIIDEATQALEAVCWIPIFKAKKLILAGDPMQLPPTILSLDKHGKKPTVSDPSKSPGAQEPGSADAAPPPAEEGDPSDDGDGADDDDSLGGDAILEHDDPALERTPAPLAIAPKNAAAKAKTGTGRPTRALLRPPRTLETTLFERLERMCGAGIKRMLNVQYRMHAQICEFPSRTLYAARLTAHTSVAARLLRDLPNAAPASAEDAQEVLGAPVVFFDTAGCEYFERVAGGGGGAEGSRCNENEATVVRNWVASLVENGVLPGQIAVITPYQAQVTLLASLLRPLYGPSLEIGTVDGMQGREKDAVVISLVRSNDNREVGFLKEKRRLNVAMTRAKRSLCVVGDSSTVQHGGAYLEKWLAWLEANADVRYAGLE